MVQCLHTLAKEDAAMIEFTIVVLLVVILLGGYLMADVFNNRMDTCLREIRDFNFNLSTVASQGIFTRIALDRLSQQLGFDPLEDTQVFYSTIPQAVLPKEELCQSEEP